MTANGIGEFSFEEFLANYWRQKPVLMKGAAKEFLNTDFSLDQFHALAKRLRAEGSSDLIQTDGKVEFIEQISGHLEDFAERARELGKAIGAPRTWFDATCTHVDDGGLGEHFDHSDNFVILLEGQETWRLSPPSGIDRETVAMRMAGVDGVGGHKLSKEGLQEFDLEAGDVLYLPLFWVHSGVSKGKTLSVSYVVPAVSFENLLAPALSATMREMLLGYQPVPFTGAGGGRDEALAKAAGLLLERAQQGDFRERLVSNMSRMLDQVG
jgi:50S ribosomal protein L16 3-hydroxylase